MKVTHECRQVWLFDTPTADWVRRPLGDWAWMPWPTNIRMERHISYWVVTSTLRSRLDVDDIAISADPVLMGPP